MKLKKIISSLKPADIFLLFFLITVSISSLFFVKEVMPQGNEVIIEAGGKQVYTLSLDENARMEVSGPHGTTSVEIKDRKVRVIDSPCENKICVKQGWVESGVIVCLPNQVVISVGSGTPSGGKLDAVTG